MKIKTISSKQFSVTNKKAKRSKIVIGLLLFLSLVLVGSSYLSSHVIAWELSKEQAKQSNLHVSADQIKTRIKQANVSNKGNNSASQIKMVSIADLPNIKDAMAKVKGSVIGSVSIPAIKTYLPISDHATYTTMLVSAAQLGTDQSGVETMGTGNYSLASHSLGDTGHQGLLFSSIKYLKVGDKIYVTDRSSVWTYTVTSNKVISPKDVNVLNNTVSPTLTLISCINIKSRADGSVYGVSRTDISAKLTSMSPWGDTSKSITSSFVGLQN